MRRGSMLHACSCRRSEQPADHLHDGCGEARQCPPSRLYSDDEDDRVLLLGRWLLLQAAPHALAKTAKRIRTNSALRAENRIVL